MLMLLSGSKLQDDEERVLAALCAARTVLDLAGVPPTMAWRDHLAVGDWLGKHRPADMVAAAELEGAQLWALAVGAARRTLRLSDDVAVEIDLVPLPGTTMTPEAHGPTRYIWRRHWQWRMDTWAAEVILRDPGSH